MSRGQTGFVPGTKWVCPRDKPRFSPYFTQWKPSLSLGQTQFVPGTFRGRRAAERVYVLKVYVPFSFPNGMQIVFSFCMSLKCEVHLAGSASRVALDRVLETVDPESNQPDKVVTAIMAVGERLRGNTIRGNRPERF